MLRGSDMKKFLKYCIIVLSLALVIFAVYPQKTSVKYSLDNCVTYFDDEARYQLIEIKDYYIQDAKVGSSIFANVTRYGFYENILYVEFDEFRGYAGEPHRNNSIYEHLYGTYDIVDEKKVIYKKIEDFDKATRTIFRNNKIMVELNSNKNAFEKWISELIPLKYRKQ